MKSTALALAHARASIWNAAEGGRSLAERLGFSADDRILIVDCDDLGVSAAANHAIARAIRAGFASTAGLMVPCPYAEEAARACRDLDIGVHLTLNAEYPDYRWAPITGASSLRDSDGYLPRTPAELVARADPDHIEWECRAQIERALEWGVDVTHLNSHMDVMHTYPRLFDIYMRLAVDYRLPVRLPKMSIRQRLAGISRRQLARAGIVSPDRFVAPEWGDTGRQALLRTEGRFPKGVSEFSLHPVQDGAELRSYDPDFADVRASDAQCAIDGGLGNLIASNGVTIIGFKPLRDVMRRKVS